MAITTYSELQTAIANTMDRDDLTTVIPEFIELAEAEIRRELRTLGEEKRAYTNTSTGNNTIALPNDFNGMRNIFVRGNPKVSLTQVSLDKLYKSYGSSYTSTPLMYAVADDSLILAPTPDSSYEIEMAYYAYDALSDSNPTSSVLTRNPDVYLQMSLAYAYQYVKDEEREMKCMAQAAALLERTRVDGNTRQFGSLPLRTLPQQVV